MPAYGTFPNSKSIYPGQSALAVGFPAIPGGPTAEQSTQYESVTAGYKSIPVCVAAGMRNQGFTQRQINWRVTFGTAPSVATWVLQGAVDDVDADYSQVDTSSGVATFTQTVASNFKFFRVLASAVTGPCTMAVKISAM